MGTGEKIEVTLSGGAPWGFRLMGGESAPLVVSKRWLATDCVPNLQSTDLVMTRETWRSTINILALAYIHFILITNSRAIIRIRKKSKAHTNGIKEGDAIITINGQSTSGRTHDESMALVDASSGSLVLEVYRGDVKDLATVSSSAAVVNGTSEPHKPDNVTSSATSETIIDGNKTTKVETQSWVHKGSDSSTTAFVHKRQTMTKDASSSSYFPLPSPLDAKYMVQPFSSKPVQVQVSAMFSDHSDDMKENVSPNVSSSPKKAVPTFNVRKFTTAKEEKWQPSDMFAAKQKKNLKEKEQYIQQQQGMWQQHQQQQQMHQRMQQQQQQYQQQQQQQQQYQQQQQQNLQWQSQSPQQQNVQWQSQSQQMAWDDAGHWKPERLEDWKPNIWEPGQEPELSQQEKEEPRLSVLEIQKKLMAPKPVAKSFQPPLRQVYSNEEQQQELKSPHHLPVFAPRVEIALDHDSAESDISSPSSSLSTKKLYSDSAFYDDPNHNYPTIQDQMKLCKAISLSLTANVNKKARGASMFAKRQRKSSRWIHDGERSSSHGAADDIAYLSDLDSELHITEGGTKPLFTFRIPSVKHRVKSPEEDIPMALSKEQFEQLRLNTKKCEHHSVAPNQCFDLAQSLKSNKGKAGRLFEKRRARSEKYVIDETNCKRPTKTPSNKLEDMLNAQNKPMSPWNAAMKGDMSGAFDHLSEYERKQKLNQMLKYEPPKPTAAPVRVQNMPIPKITHLEADHHLEILKGHDFNRKAKGWTGFQDGSDYYESPLPQSRPVKEVPPQVAPKPGLPSSQYGNYNPKIKAWHSPEPSMSSPSEYGGRVWTPISNDSYMNGSSGTSPCAMSPMGYHAPPGLYQAHMVSPDTPYQSVSRAEELPGSDL